MLHNIPVRLRIVGDRYFRRAGCKASSRLRHKQAVIPGFALVRARINRHPCLLSRACGVHAAGLSDLGRTRAPTGHNSLYLFLRMLPHSPPAFLTAKYPIILQKATTKIAKKEGIMHISGEYYFYKNKMEQYMNELFSFFISARYVWFFILIATIARYFNSMIKDIFREQFVSLFLSRFDLEKYKVIRNVMLKFGGKSTQIDHVIVSNYGTFVLETKNYKVGWVMGDEYSEYWTQIIYKQKDKLHNPIRQNYGQIEVLQTYLRELSTAPYISVIVNTTKADIKVNTKTDVIYTVNILKTIRKYISVHMADESQDRIFSLLYSGNIVGKEERKRHIKEIHGRFEGNLARCEAATVWNARAI